MPVDIELPGIPHLHLVVERPRNRKCLRIDFPPINPNGPSFAIGGICHESPSNTRQAIAGRHQRRNPSCRGHLRRGGPAGAGRQELSQFRAADRPEPPSRQKPIEPAREDRGHHCSAQENHG